MLSIRAMNADDVPRGMELKNQAGWNQTPADWQRLLHLQPDGCFAVEWEGRAVGMACTTVLGPIAWISMVLVNAAFRGRGIGTRLMEHALAYLDRLEIRTVRLDATPLGRPVYEKLGFVGEYELARWEGAAPPEAVPATSLSIVTARSEHLAVIDELDSCATGAARHELLACLHRERAGAMRIALHDEEITGFSHVRLGTRARQIGPVIALDTESGAALLDAALADHAGQPIFVDIPAANRPATAWAESHGFRVQRPFLRMVRGQPVADRPDQIWASFGPEKG